MRIEKRLIPFAIVGGYANAGRDLVCNMAGAALGGLRSVCDWHRGPV